MTQASEARQDAASNPGLDHGALLAVVLVLGALLDWLCRFHPASMPVWAPWDFSWPEYLAFALTLLWLVRGLAGTQPDSRRSVWRVVASCLVSPCFMR